MSLHHVQNIIHTLGVFTVDLKDNKKFFYRACRDYKKINHERILLTFSPFSQSSMDSERVIRRYAKNGASVKVEEMKSWGKDIAWALYDLHTLGILHRDVKPDNILILGRKKQKAQLIDLGFSVNTKKNQAKSFCGSPYFEHPNIFLKQGEYGPEVDLWAFGVTLYRWAFFRYPFEGANKHELYKEIHSYYLSNKGIKHLIEKKKCQNKLSKNEKFIDLLDRLLTQKKKQITSQELVNHAFWH